MLHNQRATGLIIAILCTMRSRGPWARLLLLSFALGLLAFVVAPADALAHGVAAGDKGYIQEISGVLLVPFASLGAFQR